MSTFAPAIARLSAALLGLSLAVSAHAAEPSSGPPAPGQIIALPLNPVVPASLRTCSAKTPSGLGYSLLRPSDGPKPASSDMVLVNYIGYLAADGQAFDQATGAVFEAGAVIPGFSEGLMLLPKGGVIRLCVPAALGYDAQGTGPIPANAALVFQVELLDFRNAAEVRAAQAEQEGQR
ncbi:MAG: hypothetical protein RIQ46_765 [Pseudomonadota bacterium]|jgi:FKBP-type peptidyl-prolyl cis-trans isomerase FkpA